jgi:hypothetical protein
MMRILAPMLQHVIALSLEMAAQTPVFLAQDANASGTGGRFYGPRLKQRSVPARAQRPERRNGLWVASEALVRPYLA